MMRPGSEVAWTDFASGHSMSGGVVVIKGVTPSATTVFIRLPDDKGANVPLGHLTPA